MGEIFLLGGGIILIGGIVYILAAPPTTNDNTGVTSMSTVFSWGAGLVALGALTLYIQHKDKK